MKRFFVSAASLDLCGGSAIMKAITDKEEKEMTFLYKLFRQDPDSREGIILTTSGLGIVANILIAAVKVVIGLLASSIAIVSEGINNASDALTSVLTLVGTKLAGKHPDKKHPFGYGRIEYLTSLIVAVLILVTGVETLKTSVERVITPEELNVSYVSILVVAISAVAKFALGTYTVKMGKKASSGALEAVGIDSRNDSFVSLVTIASSLLFLLFGFSIDAFAGIFISVLILKAGFEVLSDTVSDLLGKPADKELAAAMYHDIRNTEGVIAAVDMTLHNYGPDAYTGSCNLEIDHDKTVGEIYQVLRKLQLEIYMKYKVGMTFGIYAVDNDHEGVKEIRQAIGAFVKAHDHLKSFHAVYLEPGTERIYCDFIVDYELRDWDALRTEFLAYMAERYPESEIALNIETEFI